MDWRYAIRDECCILLFGWRNGTPEDFGLAFTEDGVHGILRE
jgi:hypothetical protein